jgi:cyclopropane-fatty-acyl-phospholipid synthase
MNTKNQNLTSMEETILPNSTALSRYVARFRFLDDFCQKILFAKLTQITEGSLEVLDQTVSPEKVWHFGKKDHELKGKVIIKKKDFFTRTLLGGSIGNAESFIDEDWDTPDLVAITALFVRNRHVLNSLDGGLGKILQPIQKLFHGLRNNTIEGSRANIRSHYDMGNDFFKLFLDESMMYSSAYFKSENQTLKEASQEKLKLICEKLQLTPQDHLLEIGTGWGAMAIYAAKHYGCRVTTTTISQEQFQIAQNKIKAEGLEDKITLLFKDYRLLEGKFSKLVSIEMIEAVGLDHLPEYFKKCSSLLEDHGLMVIQAITIKDQYYDQAKNSVDFIQRHIFPGSGIPSLHAMLTCTKEHTDLSLIEQYDFAQSYALTLKAWGQALSESRGTITQLGYPAFLYRLWHYYFSYCEGGFRERAIGVSHLVLAKPAYK